MNEKRNTTGWRFKIHEQTISGIFKRYEKNRRFDQNLIVMFDYLMSACRLLWNRENALHLFLNYNPTYKEIHCRGFSNIGGRSQISKEDAYKRYELQSFDTLKELAGVLRGKDDRSFNYSPDYSLVRILGENERKFLTEAAVFIDPAESTRVAIADILPGRENFQKSDPIVLIMDDWETNLGCLLLYGRSKASQKSEPFSDDASSCSAVAHWSMSISHFFQDQAAVTPVTYLPSYRRRHSTQAAVLFGDITNFTQLATMLRVIDASYIKKEGPKKVEQLGEIMTAHCNAMAKIVRNRNGRIERFMGDGLMAVFGEHQEDAIIAVGNAVAAACEMIADVRKRRDDIHDIIYGEEGQHEINEMVDIDFAVGINYGTVLFNYLGDKDHLEYSCIGDHVAFANRLMNKASRFDSETGDKWPPILISQTAEQHFRQWMGERTWADYIKSSKRILHAKGYGYPSYVYTLESETFNLYWYTNLMDSIRRREKSEEEVVDIIKEYYKNN